jgi:hypothetical protein
MSAVADQIRARLQESGSLLDALDAVRNRRAAIVMASTLAVFALSVTSLGGISAWLGADSGAVLGLLMLLSALIWAAILLVGGTAVGMLLADEVWARPQRTIGEALQAATAATPRTLAVMLIAAAALLAYLLALAAVLLICRLPGIGSILYAVVFPIAALVTGVVLFVIGGLLLPLAAPCIWNGDGVFRIGATVQQVFRHRSLEFVIMSIVLGLMAGIVAAALGTVVFVGSGLTVTISLAVLGTGMVSGLGGTGAGYGVAATFGTMLLFLLAGLPSLLIAMKGAAIIHRQVIAGLVIDEVAADLQHRIDNLRRPSQPMREKEPALGHPRVCPNAACGAPVGPDDAFCVECGERLK